MFSPAAKFATVLHLTTGHVLAAISSVGPEPKLEDVTGTGHVRVRMPAREGFVNVPVALLTATRVAVNPDNAAVLDRPQHYDLLTGTPPPLGLRGPPKLDAPIKDVKYAGAKAIVVWQVGDVAVVEEDVKLSESGELDAKAPNGTTLALVAIDGGPLHLSREVDH
jgi:hypothetical protein